jgi:membrane protein implicated in regulation of membrane protease activity
MSRIDWPLAITLVVVFVVMSIARWRYFMRRLTRRKDGTTGTTGTPGTTGTTGTTKGTPE